MSPVPHAPAGFRATSIADLPSLLAYVDDACRDAEPDTGFAVRLAVEEVFTNILAHGYAGDGPVDVTIDADDARVRAVIADEAPVFDPGAAPAPDLASDLLEREPGGLGWHLVRQVVDEIRHAPREGGGNTYTLIKRLPATAA